jgi:hypothetical protein
MSMRVDNDVSGDARSSLSGFGLWLADEEKRDQTMLGDQSQQQRRRSGKGGKSASGSRVPTENALASLDALAEELAAVERSAVAADSAAFHRPTARNRKQRQQLMFVEMEWCE